MLTFLLHSYRTFVGKSQPFICKVSISLVKWHAAYYLVDTDNNNVSVGSSYRKKFFVEYIETLWQKKFSIHTLHNTLAHTVQKGTFYQLCIQERLYMLPLSMQNSTYIPAKKSSSKTFIGILEKGTKVVLVQVLLCVSIRGFYHTNSPPPPMCLHIYYTLPFTSSDHL